MKEPPMQQLHIATIVLAYLVGSGLVVRASEPPTNRPEAIAPTAGPLVGLPSRPGPHIEKVRSLGDGQWLNLGQPEADPKWGQGRGRSWCQKLNFAPELRGAFLTGEGVHAFVKPDGHYMDDFFFYDINAHRWICVHPGLKAGEDQGLFLSKNGLLLNADGHPIPPGLLAHNYDQTTYDPHQRKLAFVPKGGATGWWITMKCAQVKKLAGPANAQMKGKGYSPWYLNTLTGRFEREVIEGKGPISTTGGGCLVYLLRHRKYFLRETRRRQNWLYDPVSRTWVRAADLPKNVVTGSDSVSCYDSKRGLLYMAGGSPKGANGVFVSYDAAKDAWSVLPPIPGKPWFTGNSGHMTYDTANDIIVTAARGLKGQFFYDPQQGKWLADEARPGEGLAARGCCSAFYDPANNVHYYFRAGDSREKGVMWVYRYKAAKPTVPPAPE
jgi:hypothetical protein